MPGDPEEARAWAADKRDLAADTREAAADERDVVADARDAIAAERDTIAQVREDQLAEWERRLEARARQLGLTFEMDDSAADRRGEARAAREVAEWARADEADERGAARSALDEATERRLAVRRDTLLAAAFAGIAEHLYEADTAEDLLTRVAEAAVTMLAGAGRASVTLPAEPEGATRAESSDTDADPEHPVLSIPFTAPLGGNGHSGTAALNIYANTPEAFDQSAREIGFILAAHASLAARAVGDRVRLERLGHQLEQALLSRDVIGRAKGVLTERLKTTDHEAFEILRRSSQRLNVKLREVASRLAETGEVDPHDIRSS